MKKSRKFSRSLGTHFDRSADPVYLVDANRQIAYMNPACLAWVGLEAEEAENLTCFFTSEETVDPKDDPVKGLCPPPGIFSIQTTETKTPAQTETQTDSQSNRQAIAASVFVSSPVGTDSRPATFHPLMEEEQLLAVLVVVGSKSTSQPLGSMMPETETGQSQSLHDALAAIREHHQTNYSMGNLIGTSPFAERLRRQAAAIIGLEAETLITGPPGSGREHLARTIATSCCDSESFPVTVLHCVLADDELTQESIEQIANQITQKTRRGRTVPIPASEQVTPILLLLDIDKLIPTALLQVEEFLRRNGSCCRVIATSEVSLLELARGDKFPTSIAHQLTTIEVPLVSLSQRREDIPLMAQAFVEHANRTREMQLECFDDASMQLLNEFHWPGNLEQLQQIVTAACENAAKPIILVADLPDSFRHAVQAFRIGEPEETKIELNQWLEQLELELIQRAVLQAKGNKTKAAQLLSISRSRLIRRMGHFKLSASIGEPDSSHSKPPVNDSAPEDQMIDPSAFEELE